LAHAHEYLDAQLVLKLADLPADARLRCVQFVGNVGQVETGAGGFADSSEQLKVHGSVASLRLLGLS
jgi:hypothetical protein